LKPAAEAQRHHAPQQYFSKNAHQNTQFFAS